MVGEQEIEHVVVEQGFVTDDEQSSVEGCVNDYIERNGDMR